MQRLIGTHLLIASGSAVFDREAGSRGCDSTGTKPVIYATTRPFSRAEDDQTENNGGGARFDLQGTLLGGFPPQLRLLRHIALTLSARLSSLSLGAIGSLAATLPLLFSGFFPIANA